MHPRARMRRYKVLHSVFERDAALIVRHMTELRATLEQVRTRAREHACLSTYVREHTCVNTRA